MGVLSYLLRHRLPTTALLAVSSAAFTVNQQQRRQAFGDSTFVTRCEAASAVAIEAAGLPAHYERMKTPSRASTTHAIYGSLLKSSLIEEYAVYKNVVGDGDDDDISKETVVLASVKLGHAVNGHKGIVHGGILALLIDDFLGFGYEALEDVPMAVTANLSINFKAPVPENTHVQMVARLVDRQGRKLYWEVDVTSQDSTVVYCTATSLYIIPRHVYQGTE